MSSHDSVVLFDKRNDESSYFTSAKLKASGDLEIYNSDTGPVAEQFTHGAKEYEFWYTIPAGEKDKMLKDRYVDGPFNCSEWLKAHDILYEFSNWFSYN